MADHLHAELERVYQLVISEAELQAKAKLRQQQAYLEEREAALAAAMELASVDPAVRAAFRDGIAEERGRVLALIDARLDLLAHSSSAIILRTLRQAVQGENRRYP